MLIDALNKNAAKTLIKVYQFDLALVRYAT